MICLHRIADRITWIVRAVDDGPEEAAVLGRRQGASLNWKSAAESWNVSDEIVSRFIYDGSAMAFGKFSQYRTKKRSPHTTRLRNYPPYSRSLIFLHSYGIDTLRGLRVLDKNHTANLFSARPIPIPRQKRKRTPAVRVGDPVPEICPGRMSSPAANP